VKLITKKKGKAERERQQKMTLSLEQKKVKSKRPLDPPRHRGLNKKKFEQKKKKDFTPHSLLLQGVNPIREI